MVTLFVVGAEAVGVAIMQPLATTNSSMRGDRQTDKRTNRTLPSLNAMLLLQVLKLGTIADASHIAQKCSLFYKCSLLVSK